MAIGLDIIKLDIAEGSLLGPNEGFTKNVIRKSTRYRIETATEYRFSILKPPTCSDKFAKVARCNIHIINWRRGLGPAARLHK